MNCQVEGHTDVWEDTKRRSLFLWIWVASPFWYVNLFTHLEALRSP